MNIKSIAKKILPHVIAIAVFYIITLVYFLPTFLENKDLAQGDVSSYLGWGNDAREYNEATGDYCHWSNAMFGGMPVNYSFPLPTNNVFQYLSKPLTGFLPYNSAGVFFVYMLGFYIFLLSIGCKNILSIFGAIAYALCSYNLIIIDAGHVSKALVMATMAPIIGGIILCYKRKYFSGIIITLVATGMNIYWNHQQITYYLLLVIISLAIVYFIYAVKQKEIKQYLLSSVILVIVAFLSIAPAIDKLIPTLDFSKETMRGGAVLKSDPDGNKENTGLDIDYAYMWSYGKAETFTLLIPNMYGASSHYNIGKDSETYKKLKSTGQADNFCKAAPMYWGDQPFTSGPVYAGAIVCFLFILGLIICKSADKWWILISTIIAILLSWGKNFETFNSWMFDYLPLYNKFRTPSMSLVIANFTMLTLAVMALKTIFEAQDKKQFIKPIIISLSIVGSCILLFILFSGSMFDFSGETDKNLPEWLISALMDDRKTMLVNDSIRSLLFIIGASICLFLYLKMDKIKSYYLLIPICLLMVVDLWGVAKRFVNFDSFYPKKSVRTIAETDLDRMIINDRPNDPDYRVLNLATNTFNESKTSYYHKSLGGYSPVKLRRFQDIIDYHLHGNINQNVLNMFNTRYIIYNGNNGVNVQRNYNALGHAWFVDSIAWMDTPDDEILALNTFNPKSTALVDVEWKNYVNGNSYNVDSTAVIELAEYANPGRLIYKSNASSPQLAVFSEVYYKTWKAFIDGNEVPLFRANYILRAIEVPSGNHTIEFVCHDNIYQKCHTISLIFSIVVVSIIILLICFSIYNRSKNINIA